MKNDLASCQQALKEAQQAREIAEQALATKNEEFAQCLKTIARKNDELSQKDALLQSSQTQLIQSEKLASIGQLAAGVAHEINNPVGFVLSNLESLQEHIQELTEILTLYSEITDHIPSNALSGTTKQKLNQIQLATQGDSMSFLLEDIQDIFTDSMSGLHRVRDLVASLKSYSHIAEKKHVALNINQCIENTLKLVHNELKYKVSVQRAMQTVPEVLGNEGELSQVFTNLLVNACHACEQDGVIIIESHADAEFLYASVTDNGSGIAPEKVNAIFNPFFTTKPVGVGTGLGLAVSKDIIERHDGEISVESEVGSGSTFTLKIPLDRTLTEDTE